MATRLRFDRNELSGAFGDLGTDFPLIAGLILVSGLDPAGVLILFGASQALTGWAYGIPMPVQPLKAMAALAITQRLSAASLAGGGLAIGLVMLALAASGLLERLARAIPKSVVRGIQIGLGLQLANLALREFVPAAGAAGWGLAAAAFAAGLVLLGNRRLPPGPALAGLGAAFGLATAFDAGRLWAGVGLSLPRFAAPAWSDVATGFFVLALPQLPLSLANSVLATHQAARDFFPERAPTIRRLGLSYAAMNLVAPFFGGVPVCHGSGGLAGHHAFGARTGGSVVIEGAGYALAGLFLAGSFGELVTLFPKPVLGVILLFEAWALLKLCADLAGEELSLALLVALLCAGLPYGYLAGLVAGCLLHRLRHPAGACA